MLLLAQGDRLNVNAQTCYKRSALSLAASQGNLLVVDSILRDRRTDRNSVDHHGRTALWWAACKGQTMVVRRLLADADVRINVDGYESQDALVAARSNHHFEVEGILQARRF
jgi:ankyrin repeat protein